MNTLTLTATQSAVLHFIRSRLDANGYGPTIREIGQHFGWRSPNGVMCHLKALEKKGAISREVNRNRAIRVHGRTEVKPVLPYGGTVS